MVLTPLQQAKQHIETITRKWFETILPGYQLKIKYANFRTHIADIDLKHRPRKVVIVNFSLPFIIANIHNIKSKAFDELVIHEFSHIPEIEEIERAEKAGTVDPYISKLLELAKAIAVAEEKGHTKKQKQLDAKYQRLMHTYPPYRERVKQYGGKYSIANETTKKSMSAYHGSKTALVPTEIHSYVLTSCPKCRNIGVYDRYAKSRTFEIKEGKRYCRKCKVPLRVRKLSPDEIIRLSRLIKSQQIKNVPQTELRKVYPRY